MSFEVGPLRVMAHPVRLQILSLLTGAELSATEVAQELDITQANASYHLRRLLAAGLLVVAEERSIRGGVAKIYRHPHETPTRRSASPGTDRMFVQALANELVRRASLRRTEGRSTSTDAELWVEPEAWTEAVDAVLAASVRLHAAARPPRTPGTIRTSTTAVLFQMEADR